MTEKKFIIDPEFRDKIPPLSEADFKGLEDLILKDGRVICPLIVWNGTLIDGHHRWQIIQKHPELPYTVKEMDFADKWEAIGWVYANQLFRHNISDEQKTYMLGKLYEARKNTNGGNRGNQYTKEADDQSGHVPKLTRTGDIIAKEYGVGYGTVQRAEHFAKGLDEAEKVSPGIREKVLSGEVKAQRSSIAELRKLDGEELKQAVEELKKPKEERKPKAERKPKVASEEEAKALEEIAESIAIMTDVNREYSFTIDSLAEEIVASGEAFVRSLGRTIKMRSVIVETDPVYIRQLIEDIISDIEKIKEEI